MAPIDDLPSLREVIRRHGLLAKKSLGQNFLLDLNLTTKIAKAAGPLEGVTVVEADLGERVEVAGVGLVGFFDEPQLVATKKCAGQEVGVCKQGEKLDVRHPMSMIHCLASHQKSSRRRGCGLRDWKRKEHACNKGDRPAAPVH